MTDPQAAWQRERARWHITLGTIKAALDEEPSQQCRRAAARRWCAAILAAADEKPKAPAGCTAHMAGAPKNERTAHDRSRPE